MRFILIPIGIILYFWYAQIITWRLMSIPKSPAKQRMVAGLCIFTAIAIPFWDIPVIHWKFNQLCKSEAGIHVYEEVVLGPEYWKDDGTLKTIPSKKLEDIISEDFFVAHDWGGDWSPITRIRAPRWQIKRKKDQKIIGEIIYIHRGPGWFHRATIGPHGGKEVCPDLKEVPYTRIAEEVFKQRSN